MFNHAFKEPRMFGVTYIFTTCSILDSFLQESAKGNTEFVREKNMLSVSQDQPLALSALIQEWRLEIVTRLKSNFTF